jgi:hypothetical protein
MSRAGVATPDRRQCRKRTRLNRIAAVVFVLWGSAIIIFGMARGLHSGGTAYGAGRLVGFGFGFVILTVGVWSLWGPRAASSAYEDFDDASPVRHWARPLALAVIVSILALALGAGGVGIWHHLRESRADGLAVKYGAASSTGKVSLADRWTGVLRESYVHYDAPVKGSFPPRTYARIVPLVCTIGVERGLVKKDGTMSAHDGYTLMIAAVRQFGVAHFQTLAFNELAVSRYHLAKPGEVTRLDRCLAMGYSGWEAARYKTTVPRRAVFFRAVREACAVGIARQIVPASGAPVPNSRASAELQQLLRVALTRLSR